MVSIFSSSKVLVGEIENYLFSVTNATMIFKEGVEEFLQGDYKKTEQRVEEVRKLELDSDHLRREIKYKLYSLMLIPDARGDVLGLLESVRSINNVCKKQLLNLSIEKPIIPDYMRDDFRKLTELSVTAVDEMIKGVRSYFINISAANDFINKVYFYENEVDKVEEEIKKKIFTCKEINQFSRRVHLRYFLEMLAQLSDEAEDICDRLSVYVIKRSI